MIKILVNKMEGRNDCFWYYGDVIASVELDGGRSMQVESRGSVALSLVEGEAVVRRQSAVDKAIALGYTDDDLERLRDKDEWMENNWFAIVIVDDCGNCISDDLGLAYTYDEALRVLVECQREHGGHDPVKEDSKEKQYEDYITSHSENVNKVWQELCRQTEINTTTDWDITSLVKVHDESKYSSEEFDGYRKKFFPKYDGEGDENLFQRAWNHHQKMNPHHWQYWIMWKPEGSVALRMDINYVIEMLCDWTAMSLDFGQEDVSSWYERGKNEMFLNPETAKAVETNLPLFDNVLSALIKDKGVKNA